MSEGKRITFADIKRQMELASEDIETWPTWMRRAAGLDGEGPDYNTLRAENARLRGLLAEIQYDCEHIGGIQHLDKAERRTWVSVANRIKDALQPERGTK